MRTLSILALGLLIFAAQVADIRAAQAAEPEIHYAPVENLEHIDIELIRSATKSVAPSSSLAPIPCLAEFH
jgi:hypothetical protein